jgi:hypothetical protein
VDRLALVTLEIGALAWVRTPVVERVFDASRPPTITQAETDDQNDADAGYRESRPASMRHQRSFRLSSKTLRLPMECGTWQIACMHPTLEPFVGIIVL